MSEVRQKGLFEGCYLFGKLVCVSTVGIHMPERRRGSSVTEQVHELVNTLRITRVEAR